MHFDYTITMGELITAAALFVGMIAAHVSNARKLQEVETKVDLMYRWFLSNVVHANGKGRG